ncbi:TspO/MBR family protein [Legionella maioricensis]|uniref:Tryptophan-rich sensory protein n=1 Tax=Legionella maioricensis TaxID=2896528 RepID=A0A9X2IDK5_9GAMM|nr:TspO/MBR family protein [Legionella maioricensis]MCL9685627.1 tryptophan-rich sensory protein [Legionella maioricensis]MCL9689036.1 tryptophan-rich sensory protein [Legionella maioricensis]
MNKNSWIKLTIWIVTFEAIGFFLGLLTQANLYSWYEGLNKSTLTPPGWVFGIVWPILYVLLAVAGWALWQQRENIEIRLALYFYMSQLLMNWAWTPLFFQLHWIGFSLIWILILTSFTFLTIYSIKNKKKGISLLLIPYFIWLLFATYLNYAIWLLN